MHPQGCVRSVDRGWALGMYEWHSAMNMARTCNKQDYAGTRNFPAYSTPAAHTELPAARLTSNPARVAAALAWWCQRTPMRSRDPALRRLHPPWLSPVLSRTVIFWLVWRASSDAAWCGNCRGRAWRSRATLGAVRSSHRSLPTCISRTRRPALCQPRRWRGYTSADEIPFCPNRR